MLPRLVQKKKKQECIPIGCVPPVAVAVPGGSPPGTPPPGRAHPPGGSTPREEAPSRRKHPPCGQTHACKHITLPQTSFAGGNYVYKYRLYNAAEARCRSYRLGTCVLQPILPVGNQEIIREVPTRVREPSLINNFGVTVKTDLETGPILNLVDDNTRVNIIL